MRISYFPTRHICHVMKTINIYYGSKNVTLLSNAHVNSCFADRSQQFCLTCVYIVHIHYRMWASAIIWYMLYIHCWTIQNIGALLLLWCGSHVPGSYLLNIFPLSKQIISCKFQVYLSYQSFLSFIRKLPV